MVQCAPVLGGGTGKVTTLGWCCDMKTSSSTDTGTTSLALDECVTVQYSTVLHGMVLHDMSAARYNTVRYRTVLYGTVRDGTKQYRYVRRSALWWDLCLHVLGYVMDSACVRMCREGNKYWLNSSSTRTLSNLRVNIWIVFSINSRIL